MARPKSKSKTRDTDLFANVSIRAYPTERQQYLLDAMLRGCRYLYNELTAEFVARKELRRAVYDSYPGISAIKALPYKERKKAGLHKEAQQASWVAHPFGDAQMKYVYRRSRKRNPSMLKARDGTPIPESIYHGVIADFNIYLKQLKSGRGGSPRFKRKFDNVSCAIQQRMSPKRARDMGLDGLKSLYTDIVDRDNKYLHIRGFAKKAVLGPVKYKQDNPYIDKFSNGRVDYARFKSDGRGRWWVILTVSYPRPEKQFDPTGTLGVDVGITNPVAFASRDDKNSVVLHVPTYPTELAAEKVYAEKKKKLQREFAHKLRYVQKRLGHLDTNGAVIKGKYVPRKEWSNHMVRLDARIRRLDQRIAEARSHWMWRVANDVSQYKLVVVEDLNVKGMTKKGKGAGKRGLNRRMLNTAPSTLVSRIGSKVHAAGGEMHYVDPAYTSQTCPTCGNVDKNNRSGEQFACGGCGYVAHADANGAHNILLRGERGLITRVYPESKVSAKRKREALT